jgi:hypothetical protein
MPLLVPLCPRPPRITASITPRISDKESRQHSDIDLHSVEAHPQEAQQQVAGSLLLSQQDAASAEQYREQLLFWLSARPHAAWQK